MKANIKNTTISGVVLTFVTACTSPHTLDKRVSEHNYQQASVVSGNKQLSEPIRILKHDNYSLFFDESTQKTPLRSHEDRLNVLVLSGGGASGAFGAGILNGLYDSGSLPSYSVVTGISAGALMAPFAFVGNDRVESMKAVMLGIKDSEVIGKKNLLDTLFRDAFSRGDKLIEFIEATYTSEFINEIAEAHQSGRRLLIGTAQFDSEELVVWNIGQIAASDMPNKQSLIHQVIAASASIPGVFPPQFIDVESEGKRLEELHVDGGLAAQMFLFADHIDYAKINKAMGMTQPPNVHVIRNGRLEMPYQKTADKGINLLTRTVQSMTVNQSMGDLYRMAYFSEKQGLDLKYTYIDKHFHARAGSKDMFDSRYMLSLYQYGYLKAKNDQVWSQLWRD
ncbi:patatin-like phospholipase family protein [Vibrio splendidus]